MMTEWFWWRQQKALYNDIDPGMFNEYIISCNFFLYYITEKDTQTDLQQIQMCRSKWITVGGSKISSFWLTPNKCGCLSMNVHFSRHLTPDTGTTAGRIKAVIKDGTLDSVATAHWYPHGQRYRRYASGKIEQRETQTLAVLTSRRAGKTRKAKKWKATLWYIITAVTDSRTPLVRSVCRDKRLWLLKGHPVLVRD